MCVLIFFEFRISKVSEKCKVTKFLEEMILESFIFIILNNSFFENENLKYLLQKFRYFAFFFVIFKNKIQPAFIRSIDNLNLYSLNLTC
jgi:hypothetical protein